MHHVETGRPELTLHRNLWDFYLESAVHEPAALSCADQVVTPAALYHVLLPQLPACGWMPNPCSNMYFRHSPMSTVSVLIKYHSIQFSSTGILFLVDQILLVLLELVQIWTSLKQR